MKRKMTLEEWKKDKVYVLMECDGQMVGVYVPKSECPSCQRPKSENKKGSSSSEEEDE